MAAKRIDNCKKWQRLSAKQKDEFGLDKFTSSDANSHDQYCWLIDLVKAATPITDKIGTVKEFASPSYYPAPLIYAYKTLEYTDNSGARVKNEGEYVEDNTLKPKTAKPYLDFPASGRDEKIDLSYNSDIIWSGTISSAIEPQSVEAFVNSDFWTNQVGYRPIIEVEWDAKEKKIYSHFWPISFATDVLATGFDMDNDHVEDWAVMVSFSWQGSTYETCYPAIISRVKKADGSMETFYVKRSAPPQVCG